MDKRERERMHRMYYNQLAARTLEVFDTSPLYQQAIIEGLDQRFPGVATFIQTLERQQKNEAMLEEKKEVG